jgi:hypothetical protein
VEERIATPLGPVLITLQGDDEGVRIERTSVSPDLPEGLFVDGALLVELVFEREISTDLILLARFAEEGGPEPGEHLDCVTFDTPHGRLGLATRDQDWLASRGVQSDQADYEPFGLRLEIKNVPANAKVPIGLAWRLSSNPAWPDDDASTWFAADLALPL